MENAEEIVARVRELDAMLCAVTGSMGAGELTGEQLGSYLAVCQRLAFEAVSIATSGK